MCQQGKVFSKDVTKEEISSSKSDPKPDLNKNEDLFFYWIQKQWKPKRQIKNKIIICKHITYSSQLTSVKLPASLQKDGTQIWKIQ